MDQTKQPSDATTPAAAESPPKKTCGCHRRKSWLVATVITVLLAGAAYLWMDGNAQAATVVLGRKVPKNQRVEFDRMNHGPWDGLLKAYVNAQGEVNYAAWHRSPQAIAQLDAYLAHLSMAEPSLKASREATFAFWVNAYNAVTIKGILREYPTTSIKKHTPVIGYNIWKHLLLQVGDQQISLNDMEHKVLRKMGDPRIHFAIVCASISCPRLLNEAYQPKTLEEQLTRNTQQFFYGRSQLSHRSFKQDGLLELDPQVVCQRLWSEPSGPAPYACSLPADRRRSPVGSDPRRASEIHFVRLEPQQTAQPVRFRC